MERLGAEVTGLFNWILIDSTTPRPSPWIGASVIWARVDWNSLRRWQILRTIGAITAVVFERVGHEFNTTIRERAW